MNVIEQRSQGLYETVRMVQPLLAQFSPRMIIQDIADHRLFKLNELSSDMGQHSNQTRYGSTERPESAPKPDIIRAQTPIEAGPLAVFTGTVTNQDSQELSPPSNLTPSLSINLGEAPRLKRGRSTPEVERNLSHEEDCTVVIPEKRRIRGASISKILVRCLSFTIPCNYSDRLTPGTLIEAIRLSPLTLHANLAKTTLTPSNNLLAALHLHFTLHAQGINAGDTVTLVTRHARVYDPYGVQHFVAYRDEDTIQYFLCVLQEISPIPLLSALVVCHENLPLEPTLRFQDFNLP